LDESKNAPRADVTWTTTAAAAGTFDLAGLDEDETLGIHQTVATASTLNHAWNKKKMAATCISPIAAPARPNLTRIAQFQLGVPLARNQNSAVRYEVGHLIETSTCSSVIFQKKSCGNNFFNKEKSRGLGNCGSLI
jgi:hypothetical protein